MSDAQLPPDTVEGESLPSPRSDARAVLQFDAGPGVPDADTDAAAPTIEAAADDVQPLVDLPLPDNTAPDNTAHEPSEWSGDPIPLASEPIDTPAAAPALAESADAAAAPDVPVPVEVSPIFSALDAVERAAEALLQREPAPEADSFDTGILIPRSQLAGIDEEPAVSPDPEQVPEASAGTPSEAGEIPDAVTSPDAAVPPETPQHDPAAPLFYQEQPALPQEALQDAAARIAAEATATAAALENLKRLLVHKLPQPGIAPRPPGPPNAGAERGGAPPPIPAFRPPVQLPVAPPPMVAAPSAMSVSFADYDDEPARGMPGAAVGSFLAGFALSWVFGAVLYVFLNAG